MNVSDLYVKLVDPTGKHKDVISHHRVWDGKLFMQRLRDRHEYEEDEADRRVVKLATQAEYRKSMGYKPEFCNDH